MPLKLTGRCLEFDDRFSEGKADRFKQSRPARAESAAGFKLL